jgi:hypothetical protein
MMHDVDLGKFIGAAQGVIGERDPSAVTVVA